MTNTTPIYEQILTRLERVTDRLSDALMTGDYRANGFGEGERYVANTRAFIEDAKRCLRELKEESK